MRGWKGMVGGVMTPPYEVRGSLDWCGIGLTELPSIRLAPAFLIRRFAPPSPRGKAFRGAEVESVGRRGHDPALRVRRWMGVPTGGEGSLEVRREDRVGGRQVAAPTGAGVERRTPNGRPYGGRRGDWVGGFWGGFWGDFGGVQGVNSGFCVFVRCDPLFMGKLPVFQL